MNNDNNFTAPIYYILVSEYVECTSDNSNGVVSTGFSKVSTISDGVSAPLSVNRLKNENERI